MDIVTIASAAELLTKLQEPSNYMMYRGHGDGSKHLLPRVARMSPSEEGYENWIELQDELLERFQKRSLPYLNTIPKNHLEWLIIAQHHGLPTNLLDWTTNPLKALFFAVENPTCDMEGAVWAFEPLGFYNDLTKLIALKGKYLDSLSAYFPAYIDLRVMAQESCFTFFPLTGSTEPIMPLEDGDNYKDEVVSLAKFIVPKDVKMMCRLELQKLGISHMHLFPGLDGIATTIRREFNLPW